MEMMFTCSLSISYDSVLHLSEIGKSVYQLFQTEQVVCPPILKSNVFTTSAMDTIDHNASSTTAKYSFHGTGISLIQHPHL